MLRSICCGGLALAACTVPDAATPIPPGGAGADPSALPISAPAEYDIPRITRDAGRQIFAHTGVGDPYRTGVPYPIFLAVLQQFPNTFGGDLDALAYRFGFVARAKNLASKDPDEREGLPLGMHLTVDPITDVPFVVTNCTLCHAEKLEWPGGEATVIGLGNKHVRIHAYDAAWAQITKEPPFTEQRIGRLADAIAQARHIPWPDAYREPLVAATLAALVKRATERAPLQERTAAGLPGRVATMESFAFTLEQLTGKSVQLAPTVGWAKVPDVIGYAQRTTLSWDGSQQGPIDLLAVEADVAAGVRIEWLQGHPFQGASLGAYLRQPEARPKFPGHIDKPLAAKGHALFDEHCATCHGTYDNNGRSLDYTEDVVPLVDVGTDPARAQAATESFERAANDPALTLGYTKFTRTSGYVPPILTNVWARAPYGHAGQWPSIAVMATMPEQRPARYIVELDAPYDLAAIGVTTRPPGGALKAGEYLEDGISVLGHPFLAALGEDTAAVVEYLKTL